jgi:hypothetical protein
VDNLFIGDVNDSISLSKVTGQDPDIWGTMDPTSSMLKIQSDAVKVNKNLYLGDKNTPGALKFSSGQTGSITLSYNRVPSDGIDEGPISVFWWKCYQCQGNTSGGYLPATDGGQCNCWLARCCPAGGSGHRPVVNDPRSKGTRGFNPLILQDDILETTAGIAVNQLILGPTPTASVIFALMDKIGSVPETPWEPDLVVTMGRSVTSSQSDQPYKVGFDSFNLSTTYLELTPETYSSSTTNINMYGSWTDSSSTLYIDSNNVSVNNLYFGDVNDGQSLKVSSGTLLVNDTPFSSGSGATGPQGATGADGPQGPVGATGADGSSVFSFEGVWQNLPAVYGENTWVTYRGSTWFASGGALDGNPPGLTHSDWSLFAGGGLIVGTAIPDSSSSTGFKGEIRVDAGQYLYIHTGAQWVRSSMTFSTF